MTEHTEYQLLRLLGELKDEVSYVGKMLRVANKLKLAAMVADSARATQSEALAVVAIQWRQEAEEELK